MVVQGCATDGASSSSFPPAGRQDGSVLMLSSRTCLDYADLAYGMHVSHASIRTTTTITNVRLRNAYCDVTATALHQRKGQQQDARLHTNILNTMSSGRGVMHPSYRQPVCFRVLYANHSSSPVTSNTISSDGSKSVQRLPLSACYLTLALLYTAPAKPSVVRCGRVQCSISLCPACAFVLCDADTCSECDNLLPKSTFYSETVRTCRPPATVSSSTNYRAGIQ
ncbi:hypothetical protein CBL_03161 [Carabus blaptoides fortunei]